MRIFMRSAVPGKPKEATESTVGFNHRVGRPKGDLPALGGDRIEEGGRIGVDLDGVEDVS
jgi:hypothetical protein